jgi:hypothetical protein
MANVIGYRKHEAGFATFGSQTSGGAIIFHVTDPAKQKHKSTPDIAAIGKKIIAMPPGLNTQAIFWTARPWAHTRCNPFKQVQPRQMT